MSEYTDKLLEKYSRGRVMQTDTSGKTTGNAKSYAQKLLEKHSARRIAGAEAKNVNGVENNNAFLQKLRQDERFSGFNIYAAQQGWDAFRQSKAKEDFIDQSYYDAVRRYAGLDPDASLPTAGINQMADIFRADTSWQEPDDRWDDDLRNAFGYLYSKDKAQAFRYAQEVNEAMNKTAKEEQRKAVQERATSGFLAGTVESGKAVLAGMAGIGDYLSDVAEFTGRGKITEKGNSLSLTEYSDAVTSGISEHLNKEFGTLDGSGWKKIADQAAQFQKTGTVGDMSDLPEHIAEDGHGMGDIYGMGISMATSMLSGHALGRVGSLVQFFGSAAASAVDEAKMRGATDEQALAMGFASGASESLTELIPIDNLLNMGAAANLKGALWSVLKQSGEEFLGEGANAIITTLADSWIMADKSNFAVLKQDYMKKGLSEEEAEKEACKDLWEDIAFDAISGAITGAGSAGVEMGIQGVVQNQHYRKAYSDSSAALVQQGLDAPKDSLSHTLAESYQAKLNAGGSLSGAEIRRLVKANEQQHLSAEYDAIRDTASELLTALGETENVVGIADTIAKKVTKQKVSKAEQAAFDHSSFGIWVMDQLAPETFSAEWAADRIVPMRVVAQDYAERSDNLKDGGFIQPRSDILKQQAIDNARNATEAPGNATAKEPLTTGLAKNATPELRNTTETEEKPTPDGVAEESSAVADKMSATEEAIAQESGEAENDPDKNASKPVEGDAPQVTRIASVGRNGDMKLELSDGSVVDVAEADYADDGESLIYSTIADLGAGVETSNELLNVYRNDPGGVSPSDYAAGMMEAFTYGQYHIPRYELAQNEAASALTEVQRNTAYELGSHFGGELVQSKEANIRRAKAAARAHEARMAARVDSSAVTGKVHFDRKGRTFSDAQETGLKTMEQLSKLLGVEFHVFESYEKDGKRLYIDENGKEQTAPNGWYDTQNGHIHIDLNAGSEGRGTVVFTVAHELTHHARQWAPEKFDELAKSVIELAYREQDISIAQLVQNQRDKAALGGRDLSFDEAYEEVIADSMEGILTDGNVLTELSDLIREKDATLWEKIRDWFRKLAEDIRKMVDSYKGFRPDTYEGRAVAELEGMLPALEGFYTDALLTVSENYRVSGGQKNTTQEGGKKNSFAGRDSATADHSALQRAEELARQGVGNETIRQKTGWYKGMDGKWRYEIDDSQMEISNDIINYMQLGELIQHEKLFEAYPDLADIDVVFQSLDTGVSGSYHPQFDSINLSYKLKNDPVGLKDALVHEIQHAIQHREGFTNGATAASWERKIKAGFDSRRAADIRKAQETKRELRRIQEEEPEFYRDMVELDAMTPDLPRGEIDWETLEKIEDDPVEWQRYDARREELEAKYGDTKVWDMNDLLYQMEQAAKNVGRSGVELYFDTAGEIEARDASNRRSKTLEQRKSSPPRLGNEDTVFAEGNAPADDYIPGDIAESELENGINEVAEMSPISAISGTEFTTEGRTLLDDVDRFFKSVGGQVYNSRLGDVNLTRRGVKDSLAHGMTPQKAAAFSAILDVLRNGKVVGFEKNWKHRGYDSATIAAPITIDGEEYLMAVVVHRSNSANRFYVHDVFTAKKEATPFMTGTQNLGEPGGATSTISIIRKILSVKAKQAEVNKKFSHRDSLQEKALEAARKENEKLKADVVRLKELVKLQGKVTGGTVFTEASMLTAARQLKKAADAKGDTGELVNLLKGFYRYTAEEKTLSWEGVQKAVKPAVDWLVKKRRKYRTEYAQEVLKDIRGRSISFSEEQKTEAARYMGSFNDYRKSMFGSVKISREGMSLDETWHELSRLHPGVFPEDTVPGDMPRMLTEIVERMKNSYEHTLAYGEDMMRQEFLQAILDSRWELKTVQTVADRKQAEIEQLKAAHAKEMQEVRMSHQKSLTVLRQDHQESRNAARDIRAKAEIRHKIRSTVKKLDSLLKSETKERHVPDSMKKAVADALSLLNDIELGTAEKRIQLLQAEIRELEVKQEQAKGIGDQELAEAMQAQLDEKMLAMERYEKSGSRLAALKDAYADIKNSKDPDIAAGYDAEVAGNLAELAESIKGTSFQEMSKEQLQEVYDMYTMVLTRVRDANKQLGARRGETLRENAEEVSRDIRRFGVSEDLGVIASAVRSGVRNFSWNELRPVDAFHRLGSEKLEQLYMDLVDGMAQRGQMVKEIGDFLEEARKKAGYRHFDLTTAETYTTVDGKKMKLTLAEKMSIYAYSKRAQAFDHMAEGGFTYAKGLTYKGSDGKMKVHEGKAETWRLSLEDLENICTSLTAEQQEYVDTVQQFLSEFGKHGDKVNMELYGIKLFNKEDAYFPLKSDRDYRSSVETQLNGTMTAASLKNVGMTKKTKPGANNPIVLDAFDHVVLSHLDEMVNYANLVLPLENLRRVLDYRTAPNEETEPTAMKALIGGVFGKEAQSYIEQFMVDANGTQMSGGVKNPLETMFTRNKGMAVAANLSVTIQQVSAVVRAAAEIAPQHLMWAAENGKGTKLYDEMVKYAPIAIIKDMGGFDTGNNRSLEDYIGFEEAPNSAKKVWNSMQKLFGVGAETMDKVGWCLIWNGVKREVASRKQYKVNSEEFLQECGKRFTEVIVKTQVYDSVLSRSGFMRDKHGTMRYLTSFMGEPTVQAGMVFRSHLDAARAMKSGDRAAISHSMKKLVRTDAALVGALIVNGMLKSIPYAMRDDDEDEGYWERWAKQFGSALSELWKPWELLPVFRNVEDWWSGKTIEQPDTVLLGDLMQAGHRVYDVLRDEEKLGEMTAEDWYKLAQDLSGSLGNFLGVPVRNIWRDAEGIARAWKDATDGIDSDGMMLDAFWRGLAGDEKSKHEGIYDALVNSDAARLNALKATYKTDTAYESAVRKALRLHDPRIKEMADARYEGDYDRLEALSYEIEAEGVFDMETIQSAYEAERKAQAKERGYAAEEDAQEEEKDVSTVFSMEAYYAAIRSGNTEGIRVARNALMEQKEQEYYLRHEAEASLESSVTGKVKGEYLDEDISKADAISILTKYGGKTKEEAQTEIKKWEFQMKYHYAWGSRDRAYRSKSVSKSQLIAAVMDVEGASREEAQSYIDFLELEMRNETVEITAAEASRYLEEAQSRGISISRYIDYTNAQDNYIDGVKSEAETKRLLMEVGQLTEEDAELQIKVYKWTIEGYEGVTAKAVQEYEVHCAASNVPKDAYLHIRDFSNNTKNDVNPDTGRTVNYSAMKKVMAEIDKLSLSDDQKTAIARSMGWPEKNIRKYKPW